MKRFYSFGILLAIFLFGFAGCIATHVGTMSDSASLGSANFSYKQQNLTGESKAVYILGIGGEARQSLVLEAKQKMMAKNPLQPNQALANLSVSYKTINYFGFLAVEVRCVVSADIVEFYNWPQMKTAVEGAMSTTTASVTQPTATPLTKLEPSQPISPPDRKESTTQPAGQEPHNPFADRKLNIGDKVFIVNYFYVPVDGTVVGFKGNQIIVEYLNKRGKTKTATLLEYQIQKKSKQ